MEYVDWIINYLKKRRVGGGVDMYYMGIIIRSIQFSFGQGIGSSRSQKMNETVGKRNNIDKLGGKKRLVRNVPKELWKRIGCII